MILLHLCFMSMVTILGMVFMGSTIDIMSILTMASTMGMVSLMDMVSLMAGMVSTMHMVSVMARMSTTRQIRLGKCLFPYQCMVSSSTQVKTMDPIRHLLLAAIALLALSSLLLISDATAKKSGKKKKKSGAGLFDSSTLSCLVCQFMADEFLVAIDKVDPKKMADTGSFRLNGDGEQKRTVVRLLPAWHSWRFGFPSQY